MKRYLNILVAVCFVFGVGCGGEDFSAPPAGLAKIRAKAKNQPDDIKTETSSPRDGAPAATKNKTPSDDDATVSGADESPLTAHISSEATSRPLKAAAQATEPKTEGDSENAATTTAADTRSSHEPVNSVPDEVRGTGKTLSPRDREASANIEGEVVTIGGKTAAQLKADK